MDNFSINKSSRCMKSCYIRFMNILDLFIGVFLGIGAFYGWRQGLIRAVFQLLAVVLGLYVAFHFSNQIALLFVSSSDGVVVPFLFFILVLIGVYFLVKISGRLFGRTVKFAWPSMLNNLFGAIVGSLKWWFLTGSFLLLIESLNSHNTLISQKTKDGSLLYGMTTEFTEALMPGVKKTLILSYNTVLD